jgi:hypothetical protein
MTFDHKLEQFCILSTSASGHQKFLIFGMWSSLSLRKEGAMCGLTYLYELPAIKSFRSKDCALLCAESCSWLQTIHCDGSVSKMPSFYTRFFHWKGKAVPVLNYLSTTPWRCRREWMYRATYSWLQHWMEVSGQLQSPPTLTPGKEPLVLIG